VLGAGTMPRRRTRAHSSGRALETADASWARRLGSACSRPGDWHRPGGGSGDHPAPECRPDPYSPHADRDVPGAVKLRRCGLPVGGEPAVQVCPRVVPDGRSGGWSCASRPSLWCFRMPCCTLGRVAGAPLVLVRHLDLTSPVSGRRRVFPGPWRLPGGGRPRTRGVVQAETGSPPAPRRTGAASLWRGGRARRGGQWRLLRRLLLIPLRFPLLRHPKGVHLFPQFRPLVRAFPGASTTLLPFRLGEGGGGRRVRRVPGAPGP
jgi:hypothetical protein